MSPASRWRKSSEGAGALPGRQGVFYRPPARRPTTARSNLAWYAANARGTPKKKKIISRQKAYHGVTPAFTASADGALVNKSQKLRSAVGLRPPYRLPAFLSRRRTGRERAAILQAHGGQSGRPDPARRDPDTIAAMIVEPVMGAGGAFVPPEGYFDAITRVLDKYALPLIDDEVITGFGRTGEWFGCAKYGFEPRQHVSRQRLLSSSYLADLGRAVVAGNDRDHRRARSRRIGVLGHGFTYGGHPVAAAVALEDHRDLQAPRCCRPCPPCRSRSS